MSAGNLEATWTQWDGPGLEHCTPPAAVSNRYEGMFLGFTVDLPVDGGELVLDYPGIFRRMS